MRKEVSFQLEDVVEIPNWTKDYPEHKFTVFKACFLSTAKNSHNLTISADVLKKYASTILANFIVAKIQWGDAKSHEEDEVIYGYAPIGQEIEFVESDGILKAYCYFVVSKRYSKEFNDIFEFDNLRNSSVEMTVEQEEGKSDVISFDIYGLTCLNKRINGSCPDADIKMVRFSQEEAEAYFGKSDKLSQLKTFAKERKKSMAEKKTYKVDKSKDSMSTKPWGDVDKISLGDKILDEGKEEDKKMAKEVEFAAVNIGDMWDRLYDAIRKHAAWEYCIEGIYEEDNKKFAILRDRVGDLYRLDFSLTEDGMTVADEVVGVKKEFIETDTMKKFAEPEDADKFKKFEDEEDKSDDEEDEDDDDEDEVEMSCDEMKAEMARMKADIESRDNIVMEKDKELADLRAYKMACEEKEKAMSVEAVMADVKECLADDKYKELRDEGMACKFAEIDAWQNRVKAFAFENSKKSNKKNNSMWSFSAPIDTTKVVDSLWD